MSSAESTSQTPATPNDPAARAALIGLFERVLRPLLPIALDHGLSAQDVSNALRRAYIRSLEERLKEQGRPISDARVALLAGLTRSEVIIARRGGGGVETSDAGARLSDLMHRVGVLLSVWHTHPHFSGAYGLALDLDLEVTPESPRRSFTELVRVSYPDAPESVTTDELIALGVAEIVGGNTLRCNSRAAMWGNADESARRYAHVARILEAATAGFARSLREANSKSRTAFDRSVFCDFPLTERGREAFTFVAKERAEKLVAELDSWLLKHRELEDPTGRRRYGIGVFFVEEEIAVSVDEVAPAEGSQAPEDLTK
jgi:hypothetical protein